jgi:5-methylcytosine-specific restriction endonuclease McrA
MDIHGLLDVLLDHLVLSTGRVYAGDQRGTLYRTFAFSRASAMLRAEEDEEIRRRFELRLRLALHLSPREAIAYNRSNPVPRWRLVREHLVATFGRTAEQSEALAREIAVILDNWDRQRMDVGRHREFLLRRDGPQCAMCRMRFFDPQAITLLARDEYKPYYTSPEELMSVEVDHIEAISTLGTNFVDNLQLLCRLCNAGKSDGLGVEARMEARHAGSAIADIPVTHRARMLYYVIERDRRTCSQCGSSANELTVRPLVLSGGYVRSNLQAICIYCAGLVR